ncbi:MAG: hypothetical protein ACJ75B_16245 [Flavisolibacter sp.]
MDFYFGGKERGESMDILGLSLQKVFGIIMWRIVFGFNFFGERFLEAVIS